MAKREDRFRTKETAKEEVKAHIHLILRRIALLGIEIMMLLETHDVTDGIIMDRVMSLQGYANYLVKLYKAMFKEEAKNILAAEKVE